MKCSLLFFLLCFVNFYGQSHFVEGTIIKKDSTEANGLINDQLMRTNFGEIQFKTGDEIVTYTPNDILGFRYKDNVYVSRMVKLDVTNQNLQMMTKGDESKFENRQIFLNVLVAGKASLYEYYDNRFHFFIEINDEITELINRNYLADIDETAERLKGTKLSTYRKYVGQLKLYFSDCNSITIGDLKYDNKELQKLFNAYNECVSTGSTLSKNIKNDKIDFYGLVGMAFSTFNVNINSGVLNGMENQSISYPVFGVALDFHLREKSRRWSVLTELMYSSFSDNVKFSRPINTGGSNLKTESELDYQLSTLRMMPAIKYRITSTGSLFDPYVKAGVGINAVLNHSSDLKSQTEGSNQVSYYEDTINFKSYFTYTFGIGTKFNNILVEANYNLGTKISGNMNIDGAHILLGYKF
ncbi:PorT family protein [Gelidibacter sp. F2691]|nr:PorT family protein [Gelidibacter sp. F2691]